MSKETEIKYEEFDLPDNVKVAEKARIKIKNYYKPIILKNNAEQENIVAYKRNKNSGKKEKVIFANELPLTFDGKFVGDIGEALAVKHFGMRLTKSGTPGIDGYAKNRSGKLVSVQVKATGTGRGPAYLNKEAKAQHLLFFNIDFENGKAQLLFNGPEKTAWKKLNGRTTKNQEIIKKANHTVNENRRLEPKEVNRFVSL